MTINAANGDAASAPDAVEATSPRQAGVRRDGERLVFDGPLERAACAGLWSQLQPLLGAVGTLDLRAVSVVDSAGLALLTEVASRSPGAAVVGSPAGLAELRAAYRLDPGLRYAH